jgi:hypothetical protein
MAAVVVPYVMKMREQEELERGQWTDGDESAEEGKESMLLRQARAAITIKKFILRRSCAVGSRTSPIALRWLFASGRLNVPVFRK